MYGDGLTSRSTRYTSSGSTGSTRSKRCASTTWKMSPSRMCSFAAFTASAHAAPARSCAAARAARRARRRAVAPARTATAGRDRRPRSSSRAIAPSYIASTVVGVGARRRVHVLDEVEPLAEVVERGDAARERADRVGKAEIVGRRRRQMLDLAHGVVAHPADDAAVERRELRERRRAEARASRASSTASVPRSSGTPSGGAPPNHSMLRPRATNVRAGSRPRNENRPHRSACSTDSSRKPSRSPTSFTNADSGVSRSASTSRHTGTTV